MADLLANGDVPVKVEFMDCGHTLGLAWETPEGTRRSVIVPLPEIWIAFLDSEFMRRHVVNGQS